MNFKESFSKLTLQDWIFTIFSVLWITIIVTDYLNKQVTYVPSITHFKYTKLFSFLILLGAFLSAYYNRMGFLSKWRAIPINGIFIYALIQLVIWLVTLSYNKYWKAPLDYTNYLHLAGKAIFTLGCTLLLTVAMYSVGNLIRQKLVPSDSNKLTFKLVDISLGFVVYTSVMMLLGAFDLLDQFILLGVITLMGLLNYKASATFIKETLWTPIQRPKDLNFWGGFLAFMILVYITLNYFYTQAPYPLGFDARNYYVNISKLISEAGGLVAGYQPYAWGLVMSTGYIAFKSPEITMFLSVFGGILSLFAIYDFCKNYIKTSTNISLVVVLLYLLTPTVTNQFIIEFKIDLTLVFFQLTILNFVLWWLYEKKNASVKDHSLLDSKLDFSILCILGVLLGYCLAIKVLSVFLIFSIFIGLWWYSKDLIGVIGLTALILGIVIVAKLDEQSGLRSYHLSPDITSYALLIIGASFLALSFVKNKARFIDFSKALILCSLFIVLVFSPWVYKNYTFTKSTSLVSLIMGDKPRPKLNYNDMNKNYKNSLKENKKNEE